MRVVCISNVLGRVQLNGPLVFTLRDHPNLQFVEAQQPSIENSRDLACFTQYGLDRGCAALQGALSGQTQKGKGR